MSIFITFEGGEGCGKSTQAQALWEKLSQLGIPVELTHEPGGTTLGKELRHLLKKKDGAIISPQAELLLRRKSDISLNRAKGCGMRRGAEGVRDLVNASRPRHV